MLKKALLILIPFVVFSFYYHHKTGDFRPASITSPFPLQQGGGPPPKISQKMKAILNQPFSFLGYGNQTFAFESLDERYVLKFFRFGYFAQHGEKGKRKLERVFQGYQLAYNEDRNNSALLYFHPHTTHDLLPTTTLIDSFGIQHAIPLDSVAFILQKKGRTSRQIIMDHLNLEDVAGAKFRIRQLFDMYVQEYKCGIYDHDYNIMLNTGFVEGRPMRIDVGKIEKKDKLKDPRVWQQDLMKLSKERLIPWLKKYYPRYEKEISRDIEKKLGELFEN